MKKLFPIIVSGICAVVLLIAALGLTLDFKTSAPEKVAKKFLVSSMKGNFKQASKYLNMTSEEAQLYSGMGDLFGSSLNLKVDFKVLTGAPSYNADKLGAEVPVAAVMPGLNEGVDDMKVTKVGNKWLISDGF